MAHPNPLPLEPVKSSNITAWGYDADSRTFYVQWTRGNISAYSNVAPELVAKVKAHPSAGTAVRSLIAPGHAHAYLPPQPKEAAHGPG